MRKIRQRIIKNKQKHEMCTVKSFIGQRSPHILIVRGDTARA